MSEALRAAPALALTAILTEPLPDPEPPETIAAHGESLLAVQPHPAGDVTSIVSVPPAAPVDTFVRDTLNVHGGEGGGVGEGDGAGDGEGGAGDGAGDVVATPVCVIRTVAPPIATVPLLASAPVFGATVN